jgi:hypothetical protein
MWTEERYFLDASNGTDPSAVADWAYSRTFRYDFNEPGFALIRLSRDTSPKSLRHYMVALKQHLSERYSATQRRDLEYCSAGRFDQQATTKFHLDGSPDESLLMLGYEPTSVASRLSIADYSQCAFNLSISPREFLDHHNPMFSEGAQRLQAYTTEVLPFSNLDYEIVIINNSSAAFGAGLQGVMHKAVVVGANPAKQRIVNSTMICAKASCEKGRIVESEFVESEVVSPRL